LERIIKVLNHIFPSKEEYKQEFNATMFKTLWEQLQIGSNYINVEYISKKVLEQTIKTDFILNNFGNFARSIWCSTLTENFLKIVTFHLDKKLEIDENHSDLFTNLNKLNDQYCNGELKNIGKTFESVLVNWVQELQTMANDQIKVLFELQAEEKEANDISGDPFFQGSYNNIRYVI
jgi:hypothetical protein